MTLDATRAGSAFLRWRRAIIVGLPALLGMLVLTGGQGEGLDQSLRDLRDGLRSRPASGQIHIVEIDKNSLSQIDRWPWPRGVHAAIIDRLHESGARAIAFDVDFSATSQPSEDAKLAHSLDRAGHSVILPTLRQEAGAGRSGYIDSVPVKAFENKAFLAAVNVLPDSDGYVRQMLLGVSTFGTPRPSLATMLAERSAEIDRSFTIDYAIEPDSIPRHSAADLIAGRVPPAAIAGKRFIVGATAVEMGDRYAVPRHGVIPGVVIQAIAAETLMQGPVPAEASGIWPFALSVLILLAAVRLRSRAARVGLLTAGTVLILVLPLATESLFALSVPVAPALLALVLAMLISAAAYAGERYLESVFADDETGLFNLAALEMAAAKSVAPQVVAARIDRFADIASGLGSGATAILIQGIADRLKFSHPNRVIYRVDASSLAWIEESDECDTLDHRLEAVATLMRSPIQCGRPVDVSLSFGLAEGGGLEAKQLVANAQAAAVHAAQRGERWRRFAEADGDEINLNLSLLGELDGAMADGQLWNAYQPKLDIRSGEIVGVEALVRWAHPDRGPIGPDSFIPVIEQAGRIRDLTAFVLHQALEDAVEWERTGHSIGVAVNVSATLLADHAFIEKVGLILQSHSLPASRVTIEVTESAAMDSPERAIAALESWRSHGVGISIDDYGTGQSSLGYLQKLPATELKIDKSFVQTIVTDSRNAIMVRSTIALAHELGMSAVAEGIEDAACLQLLADMGCDTAQGYHVARPMAADQLGAFLTDRRREAA